MAKKSVGMTSRLTGKVTFGLGKQRKQKKAKAPSGMSFKGGKRFKVTV